MGSNAPRARALQLCLCALVWGSAFNAGGGLFGGASLQTGCAEAGKVPSVASEASSTDAWDRGYLRSNLRQNYEFLVEYKYGTCGKIEWVDIVPNGADPPPKAVVAGRDANLKEDLYVCRFHHAGSHPSESATVPGKTWFERTNGCCNAVVANEAKQSSVCQALTVSPRAVSGSRLAWQPIKPGVNQLVPPNAFHTGNDYEHGNIFSCRIRDAQGNWMMGATWFPRDDGYCCSVEFGNEVVKGSNCQVLAEQRC